MAARQLSDGRPEGQVLGQSSTDLLAFYGGTPVARQAAVTTVTTTAATSTTNAFGYVTQAQADALVTAVNAVISRLQALGLTA